MIELARLAKGIHDRMMVHIFPSPGQYRRKVRFHTGGAGPCSVVTRAYDELIVLYVDSGVEVWSATGTLESDGDDQGGNVALLSYSDPEFPGNLYKLVEVWCGRGND